MIISSKDNATVKFVKKLADKKFRDESRKFVVEGMRGVCDIMSYAPGLIDSVIVREDKIGMYANELVVTDRVFKTLCETETSQGVLAVVNIPQAKRISCDYVLYLDGIRDPGNLGTLIRTACAAGYNDIILRGCADPYSGKTVRSTMSAIVKVNITTAETDVEDLKKSGYTVIGADMGGEDLFGKTFSVEKANKICIVVGSEANGMSDEIRQSCDIIVGIPMEGDIESLNAGVSGAIMMYNLKYNK